MYELEPDAKARVRILIAEDNLMNQKVLTKSLHAVGFRSTVANNGKEAFDKFVEEAEAGKPFDLVLMDLQMPVWDGFMATRSIFEYIKKHKNMLSPRIIAVTADVTQSVVEECKRHNMHGFISKPIRREKVVRHVEAVAAWVNEVGGGTRNMLTDDGTLCHVLYKFVFVTAKTIDLPSITFCTPFLQLVCVKPVFQSYGFDRSLRSVGL